jgi:hypothetical protein
MIRQLQYFGDDMRMGVRFRHEGFDFLRLILHFHEPGQKARRASFPISSVYCPFRAMISWLEALAVGAQDCTWHWEAEGPEAAIRFDRDNVSASLSCESYRKHRWSNALEFRISRRAVVHAFYTGLRAFAGSSEYQPERYFGEFNPLLDERPGFNPDTFIDLLLPLDTATASTILGALGEEATYDPVDDFPGDPLDRLMACLDGSLQRHAEANAHRRRPILERVLWDKLGPAARRRVLTRYCHRIQNSSAFGADLSFLRSEIVERYLSQPIASRSWRQQ